MTETHLRIVLAQINFTVGDIIGNCEKIIESTQRAQEFFQADLILFPELSITGYPPEDLLLREDFYTESRDALENLADRTKEMIDLVVGYPELKEGYYYNSAAWIRKGKIIANARKQKLPNYGVFDEYRYFTAGSEETIVEIKGKKCGLLICEDVWYKDPVMKLKQAGAECILCLNASPYSTYKTEKRYNTIKQRIEETTLPFLFANLIGGQDELIFDGGSFAMNREGNIACQAECFKEALLPVDLDAHTNLIPSTLPRPLSTLESIYHALILGIRDYVYKNGFSAALIGLSGGIDSALTLALAVDALGSENVTSLFMPSPYTSEISQIDAKKEADTLGINHYTIPIDSLFNAFRETLSLLPFDHSHRIAEENLQARIRGVLLMALSNKTGNIVLTTSNKSETAVGYSTLYGDMAGGFCVLKDISKTLVYQLAHYRNSLSIAIPERVIDRAPSAELAPNQTDQDSLPPYEELDNILQLFIEEDRSIDEIIEAGFDKKTVKKIITLVQHNEYKRRQAPPGIRITQKVFGRDRRYPITSKHLQSKLK